MEEYFIADWGSHKARDARVSHGVAFYWMNRYSKARKNDCTMGPQLCLGIGHRKNNNATKQLFGHLLFFLTAFEGVQILLIVLVDLDLTQGIRT
jgi:hypothetical protein